LRPSLISTRCRSRRPWDTCRLLSSARNLLQPRKVGVGYSSRRRNGWLKYRHTMVWIQAPELDVAAQAAARAVSTTRTKEANRAQVAHTRPKQPSSMCVVIAAKKATGPGNAARKNAMRRPMPTLPRGRKKSRAHSYPQH
jgi:hypothetical protein